MIRHEAECDQCGKRVETQAPNSIYQYWRIPEDWKEYENRDYCSERCVAQRLLDGGSLTHAPGLWTRLKEKFR